MYGSFETIFDDKIIKVSFTESRLAISSYDCVSCFYLEIAQKKSFHNYIDLFLVSLLQQRTAY